MRGEGSKLENFCESIKKQVALWPPPCAHGLGGPYSYHAMFEPWYGAGTHRGQAPANLLQNRKQYDVYRGGHALPDEVEWG